MGFWDWIKPRTGGPDVPGVATQAPAASPAPVMPPEAQTATQPRPAAPAGQDWWHDGIPAECVDLSARFEGFRSSPYRDSGGVWTIGYGSTRDATGRPVTASTPPVSREQAEVMARRDLARAEMLVRQAFPTGLPMRWAVVAILLANNLGSLTAKAQTLVGLLQARKYRQAADTLRIYRNAGGVPDKGLRRRRWAEAAYAMGMPMDEAYRRAWSEIQSPDDWPKLPG